MYSFNNNFTMQRNPMITIGLVLSLCLLALPSTLFAQDGVSIAPAKVEPHPNAMLDVQSDDKGILEPRMSHTNMTTMGPQPGADGMSVFVKSGPPNTRGFWYWDETANNNAGEWIQYGVDIRTLMPQNVILPFDQPTCPTGWSQFGAANGMFLLGAEPGQYTQGLDGGNAKAEIKLNMIPDHEHDLKAANIELETDSHEHSHDITTVGVSGNKIGGHHTTGFGGGGNPALTKNSANKSPIEPHSHKHKINTVVEGTSGPCMGCGTEKLPIMPPYYVVTWCKKDW